MSPHRANIINVLQLIASIEDQLAYQSRAPVNVATELVNQWFDDFYHPTDSTFQSEFSLQELDRLAQFNEYYEQRVDSLPETLEGLHASPEWSQVAESARELLRISGWVGVQARYDR